jgi:nucleotide-binding universal stress UspA family protein
MSQVKKVMLGYDDSMPSQVALTDLQTAGLPTKLEFIVLSVAERLQAGVAIDFEGAQTLATKTSEKIRSMFSDCQAHPVARYGAPGEEILKESYNNDVDLIVVGSHGHSTLGRIILGSVSREVVTKAKCAVRIGRKSHQSSHDKLRLIIGIDGSPNAAAAARMMASRTWPPNSEAFIITATNSERIATVEAVQKEHGPIRDLLIAAGLEVISIISEGNAAQTLLHYCERLLPNAIFVGSRGLNFLNRALLGSVSTAVADNAGCTVEVVHSHLK